MVCVLERKWNSLIHIGSPGIPPAGSIWLEKAVCLTHCNLPWLANALNVSTLSFLCHEIFKIGGRNRYFSETFLEYLLFPFTSNQLKDKEVLMLIFCLVLFY